MDQVLNELEAEKRRGAELTEMKKASQSQHWWEAPVDELNPSQLAELKGCLEALREKVILQAQKVAIKSSTPSQYVAESSNNTGFNPSNSNMVPPPPPSPPMIQPSAPSQYFVGNSSTEGIIPMDPMNHSFNPSNINLMMPPPPHQYHLPQQPIPFPSPPQHPHPQTGFNPGFNHGFH